MKKTPVLAALLLVLAPAARGAPAWPSLAAQLAAEHAIPGSALEGLIRKNQDFSLLRPEEANDKIGLPPWLRVLFRTAHPELVFDGSDPTGGYPRVLHELRQWLRTHQDLLRGAPTEPVAPTASSPGNVSGVQPDPRSESDIRIDPSDPLRVVAASNAISHGGAQAQFWSTDGGATWGHTSLPLVLTDAFHSDPAVDWTSGAAWSLTLGINRNGTKLFARAYLSTDGGATWAFDGTPSGSQHVVDKELMWVDRSPSSPFRDTIYAIWHNGTTAYVGRRSGGVWAVPLPVSGNESTGTAIGGDITTNELGDVFAGWPATGNSRIVVAKSIDGGASFGAGLVAATTFGSFDIGVPSFDSRRALIYVSLAARRMAAADDVYASWTDLSGEAGCTAPANEPGAGVASPCKTRVWFARSTDGGATWEAPRKVNDQAGKNDQFNQRIAIDPSTGELGLGYYDTVDDAGRLKTDFFHQSSVDRGVTWSAPVKTTSGMTDETVAGADSGNQYGDYNGMTGGAGRFLPSWTDRSLGGKEQIWSARVTSACAATIPGDASGDGLVDVGDVFHLINALFAGGPPPVCGGDVNGDGRVDVGDVFYLVSYLFAGGPPPASLAP